jgi:phosphate/phosphite/phosphonate ABC transporter binding protein
MMSGHIDVGWLPPLVYLELERRGGAQALLTSRRAGKNEYACVLVVRSDTPYRALADLAGARVAWVDPLSASGYVFPRIQLASKGYDPRKLFSTETFFGAHDVSLAAVADRTADVTATFAQDRDDLVRGRWREMSSAAELRVLENLGSIPMDLLGVRPEMPAEVRARLTEAFVAACHDERVRGITRRIFDVEEFSKEGFARYDDLRSALGVALEEGIIDATSAYIATIPPPPP